MLDEIVYGRRSIRKYRPDDLAKKDIEEIIRAGAAAPSAKNRQPWKYTVCTGNAKNKVVCAMEQGLNREKNEEAVLPKSSFGLPDAFHTLRIMKEAPVIIVVENTNGSSPYEDIDTDRRISEICDSLSIGASIQNMLLKATELNIGSLWIANTCFAYPELAAETGIKGQLVGVVALGYADENPPARPRKPMEEIVEYMN